MKIIEEVFKNTDMGINSLQKEMNRLNGKGEDVPQLATELTTTYQQHINTLRNYL